MEKYASKMIELAQSWIGKKEADGSHKYIIDTYNGQEKLPRNYKMKYSDSWCAATISALAIKLDYTDIIPTECSCQQMIELFKDMGCWIENENRTPKAGEIIFYDWQDSGSGDNKGWSDHVGIVEKVSGTTITVIEGNYGNAVKRRYIAVNGKYIRGYGVPKYDAEPVAKTDKLSVDGEWGKDTTKMSQKVLGTTQDGIVSKQKASLKKYVPNALTSSWEFKTSDYNGGSLLIKAIQRLVGASVDGQCGQKTVKAMQKFLNKNGFKCGTADGVMGEKTVKAWQQYLNSRL